MPAVLAASQLGHEASWDPRILGLVPVVPPRVISTASMCGMYDKCLGLSIHVILPMGPFLVSVCTLDWESVIPAPLGVG